VTTGREVARYQLHTFRTRANQARVIKEQLMYPNISPQTTVAALVDHWLQRLRAEERLDRTTIDEYERVLRKLVVPRLGGIRLHELTTDRINMVLAELGARSLNRQRKAKVVTGAMLDTAVEHGALCVNPVRGSVSISRPRPDERSLTLAEVEAVRAAVQAWLSKERSGPKSSGDMADIIELMLATRARIGEVLALRWRDIDLDVRAVEINATIKTEPCIGSDRKTLSRPRTVALPERAALILEARRTTGPGNFLDAVFPTRNVTWQQVNNVERRWRQIRREAGLEWVTPEVFRRSSTEPVHSSEFPT
jgi:integrase